MSHSEGKTEADLRELIAQYPPAHVPVDMACSPGGVDFAHVHIQSIQEPQSTDEALELLREVDVVPE